MDTLHKKIENIREKPKHVRERILVISMLLIAVGLFGVWISTFSSRARPVQAQSEEKPSVLSSIGSSIRESVNGAFSNFPSRNNSTVEQVPTDANTAENN